MFLASNDMEDNGEQQQQQREAGLQRHLSRLDSRKSSLLLDEAMDVLLRMSSNKKDQQAAAAAAAAAAADRSPHPEQHRAVKQLPIFRSASRALSDESPARSVVRSQSVMSCKAGRGGLDDEDPRPLSRIRSQAKDSTSMSGAFPQIVKSPSSRLMTADRYQPARMDENVASPARAAAAAPEQASQVAKMLEQQQQEQQLLNKMRMKRSSNNSMSSRCQSPFMCDEGRAADTLLAHLRSMQKARYQGADTANASADGCTAGGEEDAAADSTSWERQLQRSRSMQLQQQQQQQQQQFAPPLKAKPTPNPKLLPSVLAANPALGKIMEQKRLYAYDQQFMSQLELEGAGAETGRGVGADGYNDLETDDDEGTSWRGAPDSRGSSSTELRLSLSRGMSSRGSSGCCSGISSTAPSTPSPLSPTADRKAPRPFQPTPRRGGIRRGPSMDSSSFQRTLSQHQGAPVNEPSPPASPPGTPQQSMSSSQIMLPSLDLTRKVSVQFRHRHG